MSGLKRSFVLFSYFFSESGATAVEYGLIAAGIAVVILTSVFAFGENMRDMFGQFSAAIGG